MRETIVTVEEFESPLGWIAIARRDGKVSRILFGFRFKESLAGALACAFPHGVVYADESDGLLGAQLLAFAHGKPQDFSHVELDTEHMPRFSRRVVAACREIPWGQTATYKDLARRSGAPSAARAVGNVMANNRFPLVVPCHRVLAADGKIGGFSAPDGLQKKRRLLELEQQALVVR